jgi:hypothetical protein
MLECLWKIVPKIRSSSKTVPKFRNKTGCSDVDVIERPVNVKIFEFVACPDSDKRCLTILMFSLQDSYIQSRADTMQNIEQTIVELGGIFTQLAHMVKEQEEIVKR